MCVAGMFLNFSDCLSASGLSKLSRVSAGGEADGIGVGVDSVGPRGKNWSERRYEVMADKEHNK